MFNLGAGYAAGCLLGTIGIVRRPMRFLAWDLVWLPIYWLLMSLAAWRAAAQIIVWPFHWEKTRHGLAHRSAHPGLSGNGDG